MADNNNYYTVIESGYHVQSCSDGTKQLVGYKDVGVFINYRTDLPEVPIFTAFPTEAEAVNDVNEHPFDTSYGLPHLIKMPVYLTLIDEDVDLDTGINSGGYANKVDAFKENGRPWGTLYNDGWLWVYALEVLAADLYVIQNDKRVLYVYNDTKI